MKLIIDIPTDRYNSIVYGEDSTELIDRVARGIVFPDEIISRIEEARDKDKIAEYPYNRCIKIIREVLGDD